MVGVLFTFTVSACKSEEDPRSESTALISDDVPLPRTELIIMPTATMVIVTQSLEPTLSPTASFETEPTPSPPTTPTVAIVSANLQSYPESHYIDGVTGHSQYYYLSCESSAAVDWAWFFDVHIYESTFQADLPRSDNPDLGYVGDFTTRVWGQIPPYSYGVHAGPIAESLRAYDLPAIAVKGYTLDEIKQKLSEDKPIIAWIIGNLEYSEPVEYVDQAGNTVIVAPYEHVVILTGYNAESIRYMNNGKFFDAPTEVFLTSWGVLGNMVVIHE